MFKPKSPWREERTIETSSEKIRNLLECLREGNRQYVAGGGQPARHDVTFKDLKEAKAVAAVLTCSDMQAVPEQLFGLASGALFVMQTAGNCAGADEAAGALLASESDGIDLVIVLGHSPCRVIETLDKVGEDSFGAPFEELRLSAAKVSARGASPLHSGVQFALAHASRMATHLRSELGLDSGIAVVAAYLHEATGHVEFL